MFALANVAKEAVHALTGIGGNVVVRVFHDAGGSIEALASAFGTLVIVIGRGIGGRGGNGAGVFPTAHVAKETVHAIAVIGRNFVVQVLQDARRSVETLVSACGAHLFLGNTRTVVGRSRSIYRIGPVAPIARVGCWTDTVVFLDFPVGGRHDTKATVLALVAVFRADGFVGGGFRKGRLGGGLSGFLGNAITAAADIAEDLVAPVTVGDVGAFAVVVARVRKDYAVPAVLADIGILGTNDYVVIGHGE